MTLPPHINRVNWLIPTPQGVYPAGRNTLPAHKRRAFPPISDSLPLRWAGLGSEMQMSTFSFHSPYVASKIRGNIGPYGTSIAMGSKTRKYEQVERDFLVAYDENADALFRHCFARVRDRELAKDITQETFVRTWEYLAKGKQIEHPRAFLYRTLNNCLVDTMRKKRSASLDAMTEETGFELEGAP